MALRTGGNGGSVSPGEWLTPNTPNGGRSVSAELVEAKGLTEDGKRTVGLESQTKHWPTPDCNTSSYSNGDRGENIREAVNRWPTPNSRDHKGEDLNTRTGGASLSHYTEKGQRTHCSPPDQPTQDGQTSSPTAPSSPRRLNPEFVEKLMGWPIGLTSTEPTACDAEAMALWRSKLRQHLSDLFGE